MNKDLMPQLSPPVARTLDTQSARLGERGGVEPMDTPQNCLRRCGSYDNSCYVDCIYGPRPDVPGEDGSLVASFPSVKW